jgi:hypothetical protein
MRTLKYALVSILGLAMLMSAQTASVKSYSDPDAREVYRALITPQAKRPPLLLSTTVKPWICSVSPKEIADPEYREAVEVFQDVNQEVWDLSSVLSDRKTISQPQLDEIFKPGAIEGWKLFREKYPDFLGYVALSAVGFNNSHTVAVVYSEGRCGGKCGAGGFKYFRRTPRGWQRAKKDFPSCDWIS